MAVTTITQWINIMNLQESIRNDLKLFESKTINESFNEGLNEADEEVEAYRLEMTIFTNFKGTEEEAKAKLEEDLDAFESGQAGWFSDNYMPTDQRFTKIRIDEPKNY
jgi:hypothetical protein